MRKKYKVEVQVKLMATCTIEVTADSEKAAIDKAEDEVAQWDADDFDRVDVMEAEAGSCQEVAA